MIPNQMGLESECRADQSAARFARAKVLLPSSLETQMTGAVEVGAEPLQGREKTRVCGSIAALTELRPRKAWKQTRQVAKIHPRSWTECLAC